MLTAPPFLTSTHDSHISQEFVLSLPTPALKDTVDTSFKRRRQKEVCCPVRPPPGALVQYRHLVWILSRFRPYSPAACSPLACVAQVLPLSLPSLVLFVSIPRTVFAYVPLMKRSRRIQALARLCGAEPASLPCFLCLQSRGAVRWKTELEDSMLFLLLFPVIYLVIHFLIQLPS